MSLQLSRFPIVACLWALSLAVQAADPAVANHRSGISLHWIGTPGVDYVEEYFYHDKRIWDFKVVYLKANTKIAMELNSYASNPAGGAIKYRVDRDLNYDVDWRTGENHHQYQGPFSLSELQYEDGAPVVGTTGPSPGIDLDEVTKRAYYHRGITDKFGDEWHSLTVARDVSDTVTDEEYNVTDGKLFLFVVNPKTPALTVRAEAGGQFYTTPPKYYFLPTIHAQATYIDSREGSVAFEIKTLNDEAISYRIVRNHDDKLVPFVHTKVGRVMLNDKDFAEGQQLLQYYYAGREGHVKTRIVIKKPAFPSANEKHGNLLWGGGELRDAFLKKISTEPLYKTWWSKLKNEKFHHGIPDKYIEDGSRKTTAPLPAALIAYVEGADIKPSRSSSRSFADFAKEFLLKNLMRIDPVGLEQHHNGAGIPSREVKDRGYYTVGSRGRFLDVPFAYDLLISFFRSDQHPRGITPIEDLYIRDSMARWVMFTLTEIGGYNPHNPGMWGRSRFIASQVCTLAMPDYATPYFGTSGVSGDKKALRGLPFPDVAYTWKEIFIDEVNGTPGYPNPKFKADLDGMWTADGAEIDGVGRIGRGVWRDRIGYHTQRMCGWPYGTLAMMSALHTKKQYPNFFAAIARMKRGDLWATKKLSGESVNRLGPVYGTFAFTDNSMFPENTEEHVAWATSQASVVADYFKYGGPYTLIWFDSTGFETTRAPSAPKRLRVVE